MGIRSVASEEDYYTLKADVLPCVERGKLDEMNKAMETDSAPLITRLLTASRIELSDDEKEKLAIFISCLAARNPFRQEQLMNLDITMRKTLLKITAESREGFHEHAKKYRNQRQP